MGDGTFLLIGATVLVILMSLTLWLAARGGGGGGGARKTRQRPGSSAARDAGGRQAIERRVNALLRELDPDDAQSYRTTSRQLLSMGPGIVPTLWERLGAVEGRPTSLAPGKQLLLEEVLVGFGLQGYLKGVARVRAVHRASPVFPAVLRVLEEIGPNVIAEMVRGPQPDAVSVIAPLLFAWGPKAEDAIAELLAAEAPDDALGEVMVATLSALGRDPERLERWFERASPSGRRVLVERVLPWGILGSAALAERALSAPEQPQDDDGRLREAAFVEVVMHAARDDSERLSALVASGLASEEDRVRERACWAWYALTPEAQARMGPHEGHSPDARALLSAAWALTGDAAGDAARRACVEDALEALSAAAIHDQAAGLVALAQLLDDPRAEARLLHTAQNPSHPFGALALLLWGTRSDHDEAFGEGLAMRARGAELTPIEWLLLRVCALTRPKLATPVLARLLRSDSPRVCALAAQLLAPLDAPIESVLIGLGRHRYSPLEAQLAPLIWARWARGDVAARVAEQVASKDRHAREAAVLLVAGLGSADHLDVLMRALGSEPESVEGLLNAIERCGPAAQARMEEFAQARPSFTQRPAFRRRLALLRALGAR